METLNPTSKTLTFHILDIQTRDQRVESETEEAKEVVYESGEEDSDDEIIARNKYYKKQAAQAKRELVIHLFGATPEGKPVRVDVTGFRPSFYLKLPDTNVGAAIESIKLYILNQRINLADLTFQRVNKKKFYGFTANRPFNFLYITCPSLTMFRNLKNLFLNDKSYPATKAPLTAPLRGQPPEVYEANIDPMLRFLHVQNLQPCGWVKINDATDYLVYEEDGVTIYECNYEEVTPTTGPRATAPFLVASWDIECYSASGEFPQAEKGDPVIQVGIVLTRGTVETTERHLFAFPSCDPIEGTIVHESPDEKTMLIDWFKWMEEVNPDILIGYNVFGFDERYVWKRAEKLGLDDDDSMHSLTRLKAIGSKLKCEEKFLSSSALGDNMMYIWSTHGRLQVDLYHYIKRSANLPSYKLDEVTKQYMSGKLKKHTKEGDDLVLELSGAIKDIKVGRAICLLDATGESITDKLVIKSIEGSIVKIHYSMEDDTFEELEDAAKWVVVKDDVGPQDIFRLHRGNAKDRAVVGKYCIQDCDLVLELYKKLEVFNNAMSMANVCSVPVSYIFVRGQGIKIESLIFKACRERDTLIPVLPSPNREGVEDSYEGAIVLDPVPGFYHKSPIGVADFASLYPSSIESENISHDSLVWVRDYNYDGELIAEVYGDDTYDSHEGYGYTDIEFDLWRPDPADTRKHPEKIKVGRRICRYAQPLDGTKSTLPEIIRQLLAARKAKRKEGEKETNPERAALLDAEQLAYKLTANSLYGQLGSSTFKIRLQHLAASVTAYGRKQIMFAKEVIDRFYGPEAEDPRCRATCEAKVVYGDSVTGDTPLVLQTEPGRIIMKRIDEIISESTWTTYHDTKESIDLSTHNIKVWTETGFTKINRLIRHKLAPGKKLFRITTHTGTADVTEDHSLVLADGSEVKPSDISLGTELLHNDEVYSQCGSTSDITVNEAFVMGFFVADGSSDVYHCPSGTKASWAINKADTDLLKRTQELCPFPTKILDTLESSGVYKLVPDGICAPHARRYRQLFYNQAREKRIPDEILNAPIDIVKSFWDGFYAGDGDKDENGYIRFDQKGKQVGAGLCILARRLGYSVSINDIARKENTYRYTMTMGKQRKNPIAIKKIRELPHPGPDAYVYDLETDNHHFAVGPGALVVHNTDSLFVEFNPRNPETGERLTGRDARQAVIDLTAEAGKLVTKALAPPHDFEFDKIFDPMIMFSKKRYAGNMFENNADEYVHKYMGIALKRRDNAPIVKTIFGTAMKKLLNERDIIGATEFVKQSCVDLVDGKVSLGQLTITKSLRADYADPSRIAHKALADRMAERDPGNAPAAGDRIGYIYIKPKPGQEASKLQGDRIEHPSYVKENNLLPDYQFYIEHQIQNPVAQMFGLLLDQMPGFDTKRMSLAPLDADKRLVWCEQEASNILFGPCLQKCSSAAKAAFVNTFFGSNATTVPKGRVVIKVATKAAGGAGKESTRTTEKKPQMNTFLMDKFIIKEMKQKEAAAKKAAKSLEE
jgi:DNA polymerase elongation subunit (family B)